MKGRTKLWLIGLAALLVLSVAGAVSAQESTQPPRGPAVQGRVEGKLADGFTLTTRQGMVTVKVDELTRYQVPGIEQPSLADVHIGDPVLVLGRRDEDGSLLARMVKVLPPVPVNGVSGEVQALEGATGAITVATAVGDKVLLTDENTRFRVPGVEQPTLEDVHVGDRISAIVQAKDDGSLLAKLVAVLPEGARAPVIFKGRVAAVTGDALRLRVRENVVTIGISSTTQIWVPGVENPTLDDLQVGDWVLVIGRQVRRFAVEALGVIVQPPVPAHRYVIAGEVTNIEGTTLTVADQRDTHSIFTDDQTRFFVPGVEQPSLADIHVGDHIMAVGKPEENRALLARWIAVKPAPPAAVQAAEIAPSLPPEF